jgi:4-hydroxy-tetrahydrodipicolinate reductase
MNILICGVGGRMGREVAKLALDGVRGANIVAGFDVLPIDTREFPTYTNWNEVTGDIDCIVDFSHHSATEALLNFAVKNEIPTVIATTGHSPAEKEKIAEASKIIPVFHSANMSIGIAVLAEFAKMAALAFPDADIEIIEKHHNRKLDAPSGTAFLLANAIKEVREDARFVYGRDGLVKRQPNEIGIHAVRMGNIIGEHEIIIGTDTQTITLKHEAHGRALFAEGALAAANFLCRKPRGLYGMEDFLQEG